MSTSSKENRIKRSRAAELLDKTPRTLRRYEVLGLLTPIKQNCRSTVYRESEVFALMNGEVQISKEHEIKIVPRAASGQFASGN